MKKNFLFLKIKTLKNKIYKYMALVSKNVYIGKLMHWLINATIPNNGTIKMKPIDANSSTYIDFGINYYDKDPKFKMGNHVKTSKYKFF